MPPKNKKQLEEQAKRLEEEQKKKQEQERKLEEQRKRYAAEKLNTGLVLPVSNQLITDFSQKQSSFVTQKFREVLLKEYESLKNQNIIKQLEKQMLYTIKNIKKVFELAENVKFQENNQKYLKTRVVCGLYLQLFLNKHPQTSKQLSKVRAQDQNLLKQLLLNHSQSKKQGQQKIFNKEEIFSVLKYFKENYFNHYLILHKFNKFQKRQDQRTFNVCISSPVVQLNTAHTTFVDLSNLANNQGNVSDSQDKRSDGANQ